MTSEALYERYKDALKRGHVASLRGRTEEALVAYGEAAAIAPERSTPHTSAGTALLGVRRPAEALRWRRLARPPASSPMPLMPPAAASSWRRGGIGAARWSA